MLSNTYHVKGNQHGSCEYDDLQNWLDMTSHENPLLHGCVYFEVTCQNLVVSLSFTIDSIHDAAILVLKQGLAKH